MQNLNETFFAENQTKSSLFVERLDNKAQKALKVVKKNK